MIRENPKTKEELAYERLKTLILDGELPKSRFLSQRMLAEKVGTNITTIRTALRQLESDSLIENVPQWGVRIPLETEEILRDRYFMRELLEVGAVRLIVQRRGMPGFDSASIIQQAKLCDAISRETPKDVLRFSKAHFDFHVELAKHSGSPLLLQSLSRIHFRSLILQNARRGWARGLRVDHENLVEAILSGDEATAVEQTIKHIKGGLESELIALRQEMQESASE